MDETDLFIKNTRKLKNEGIKIEYKEIFNFGSLAKYFKTMMAFANNKGGVIFFGITDSPRTIIGLDEKSQFYKIDNQKIVQYMKEDMSTILDYEMDVISVDDKYVGYIKVEQLKNKPVICKKNEMHILKEGSIYYRYAGRSELIGYAELRDIIDEIKINERNSIMSSFNTIIKEGPENVKILNTNSGVMNWNNVPIMIDEQLMNELKKDVKFVESGKFVDDGGDPTLKVIGTLSSSPIVRVTEKTDINNDYPYLMGELAKECGVSNYYMQTIIYHLKIKDDSRFSTSIRTSSTSSTKKYSQAALELAKEEINNNLNDKEYYNRLSKEYSNRNKHKKET